MKVPIGTHRRERVKVTKKVEGMLCDAYYACACAPS